MQYLMQAEALTNVWGIHKPDRGSKVIIVIQLTAFTAENYPSEVTNPATAHMMHVVRIDR